MHVLGHVYECMHAWMDGSMYVCICTYNIEYIDRYKDSNGIPVLSTRPLHQAPSWRIRGLSKQGSKCLNWGCKSPLAWLPP